MRGVETHAAEQADSTYRKLHLVCVYRFNVEAQAYPANF